MDPGAWDLSWVAVAVAIFDRATNGTLTQKAGTAGCIVDSATPIAGCTNTGKALDGAFSVTISPDGASANVASWISDAVVVFERELPPVTPVSPTELNLTLKLSKHLSGSKLKATVGCDLDCTTTLRGTVRIKVKSRGRAGAAARQIKSKRLDLVANESAIVKLKVQRRDRSTIKRALRRGHKVKAAVRLRAKDADGIVEKTKVKVRLR